MLNPPDQFVSTPGGSATFICFSLAPGVAIVSFQWLVNESLVENLNLSNVRTEFTNSSGLLIFDDIPVEYNMSRISCMATCIAEGNSVSLQSNLILQGES